VLSLIDRSAGAGASEIAPFSGPKDFDTGGPDQAPPASDTAENAGKAQAETQDGITQGSTQSAAAAADGGETATVNAGRDAQVEATQAKLDPESVVQEAATPRPMPAPVEVEAEVQAVNPTLETPNDPQLTDLDNSGPAPLDESAATGTPPGEVVAADAVPKGSANANTRVAAARGSTLHSDQPGNLPDQLRSRYPDTEFRFAKPGQAGQDVRVTGGVHPSAYPTSSWPKDVDFGDFKPDTAGGTKTFNYDQKYKWTEPTHKLTYDPVTGKLVD
jgi:hypothetical protein